MLQHTKEYEDSWNEICFILSESIKPDINEAAFQKEVIRVLERLGWRQFKKELLEQVLIPSGTSNKKADIVVQSADTGMAHFVIEIKRPQNDSTEQKTANQLLSYMRFKKCELGIIIGNMITVIWDDRRSTSADYVELAQIPFSTVDNPDGNEFARIFSKEVFTAGDHVQSYIQSKVYNIQQKSAYNEVKKWLFTQEFHDKLIEYIRAEISSVLNSDLTGQLLDEISLSISSKHLPNACLSGIEKANVQRLLPKKYSPRDFSSNGPDYTQYLFDGRKYGKGRLALAIVKKYVEMNPGITFAQLEMTFPKYLQGSHGVFAKVEKAIEDTNREQRKRHFIKPEETIKLKDGEIAVSTQWGILNIGKLIQAANSMKFNITVME